MKCNCSIVSTVLYPDASRKDRFMGKPIARKYRTHNQHRSSGNFLWKRFPSSIIASSFRGVESVAVWETDKIRTRPLKTPLAVPSKSHCPPSVFFSVHIASAANGVSVFPFASVSSGVAPAVPSPGHSPYSNTYWAEASFKIRRSSSLRFFQIKAGVLRCMVCIGSGVVSLRLKPLTRLFPSNRILERCQYNWFLFEVDRKVNICALCLPPRSKLSTSSTAASRQRGITANKRFALRGLMNRKNEQRSKLRGMNPVAIQ